MEIIFFIISYLKWKAEKTAISTHPGHLISSEQQETGCGGHLLLLQSGRHRQTVLFQEGIWWRAVFQQTAFLICGLFFILLRECCFVPLQFVVVLLPALSVRKSMDFEEGNC